MREKQSRVKAREAHVCGKWRKRHRRRRFSECHQSRRWSARRRRVQIKTPMMVQWKKKNHNPSLVGEGGKRISETLHHIRQSFLRSTHKRGNIVTIAQNNWSPPTHSDCVAAAGSSLHSHALNRRGNHQTAPPPDRHQHLHLIWAVSETSVRRRLARWRISLLPNRGPIRTSAEYLWNPSVWIKWCGIPSGHD